MYFMLSLCIDVYVFSFFIFLLLFSRQNFLIFLFYLSDLSIRLHAPSTSAPHTRLSAHLVTLSNISEFEQETDVAVVVVDVGRHAQVPDHQLPEALHWERLLLEKAEQVGGGRGSSALALSAASTLALSSTSAFARMGHQHPPPRGCRGVCIVCLRFQPPQPQSLPQQLPRPMLLRHTEPSAPSLKLISFLCIRYRLYFQKSSKKHLRIKS